MDGKESPNTNTISELARQLAAQWQLAAASGSQRQIVQGTCEICGKLFTGTRKRRYYSHNCAQKAYMRNKARGDRED